MPKKHLQCFVAACLFCSVASAEQSNSGDMDLFELSLRDLMTIQVVSKQTESITTSPAIVSSYNADQMQSLGLNTVIDFIDFITSIEVNEAFNGSRIIQMRGLPSRSNQKILFLIDGVPYWAPENGDIPLLGMPIESIEKIEVIRGPGAVVYGTNASAGVINIVPKSDVESSLAMSSNIEDRSNASFYHGSESDSGARWSISAEVQNDEGYSYQIENGFNPLPPFSFAQTLDGKQTRQSDRYSVYSQWQWQGFNLAFQAFKEEMFGSLNSSPATSSINENEGRMLSLSYQHDFDFGALSLYMDWNQFLRTVTTDRLLEFFFIPSVGEVSFDNRGDNNDRLRHGISWKSKLSETWSLLAGLEYERRRTENQKFRDDNGGTNLTLLTLPPLNQPLQIQPDGTILLVEGARMYEKAAYIQPEFANENWRIVFGGRYIENNIVGRDFSPRGAVVYSLSERQSVKLLFSEGFNTPTFGQLAATDIFGMPTDNDVDAETIQSWDLAYTQTDNNDHYVVSLFRVEAKDLIFNNTNISESILRTGAELELFSKYKSWDLLASLTYVDQGNHDADNQSDYASSWLMKLGANYRAGQHTLGSSLRSSGPRRGVSSSHILNGRYAYQSRNGIEASLSLINILDERRMQPSVRQLNDILVEAEERFGVVFGVKFTFD